MIQSSDHLKKNKGKWRERNVTAIERNKINKNSGLMYKMKNGKEKAERIMGPPCTCDKKCRQKMSGRENEIFQQFWQLGCRQKQNIYLYSLIESTKVLRRYKKKTKKQISRRGKSFRYYIKIDGIKINICKHEFTSVHGLSRGRVDHLRLQVGNGYVLPAYDKRGKHHNRPNRTPIVIKQSVRNHIESIPIYTSHYSRNKNPGKMYFDCDLTVSKLYKEKYLPYCNENNVQPVKEDMYRRIFSTEYNIGFKLPKSDTCATCDRLKIDIDSNVSNEEILKSLNIEQELHQKRAEVMQTSLQEATEDKNADVQVISFDLQQTLPTPLLTVGPAFYLRKAWTYNLGVHDCKENKGFMFMWTEDKAKRGSSEVASVLFKFFRKNPPKAKKLLIYTDNCAGQNKNWVIMSFWLQMIREQLFEKIEHRFLESGHTFMPSDRDFALIEKYKKKYVTQAFSPDDWYEAVRKSNKKKLFEVTVMEREDFYDFNNFLNNNVRKKSVCVDKSPLNFSKVRIFSFDKNTPNEMFVQHALSEEPKSVNLSGKVLRTFQLLTFDSGLKLKYSGPLQLDLKKIIDLKKLMKYIPPIHHDFYNNLKGFHENQSDCDEGSMLEKLELELSEDEICI